MTQDTEVAVGHPTMVLAGINKSFAGVHALRDVSFEVKPGEVHALLGENGAGKSTLMAIASGVLQPDTGTITFDGAEVATMTPQMATQLGIAIVYQHPAVLPDMTVAENMRVALPRDVLRAGGSEEQTMRGLLAEVGADVHLEDRVEGLTVAQKHLLEIAKGLAIKPKLLILDEPTAPLDQDSVDLLFTLVRTAASRGTAVVYITHRLAEIRVIADRVTVLRDGKWRGTANQVDVSDDELLALIVGRELSSTFPPKHQPGPQDRQNLLVDDLSGDGFSHVSLAANAGEIVGIAGVVGNGQSELLRALAGLHNFSGQVSITDTQYNSKKLLASTAYMPNDRHREGLMMTLSVRENSAISSLTRFKSGPLLSRKKELDLVYRELDSLAVKAPSIDADVSALSGGNQQKVVMARSLLSQPTMILADEPTQGVDVGARAEIYRILRDISETGVPVVVASSDAIELAGLCDRVIVMSRGNAVETLTGTDVTEEKIVHAAVRATAHKTTDKSTATSSRRSNRVQRFMRGDYAPVVILAIVMVALGAYIFAKNSRYFNAFNVSSVMLLSAALGFIAMGQTIALLVGGIDLSVGPLAGFMVIIASFFVNDGKSTFLIILGLVLMFVSGGAVGAINGSLIRYAKFTPVAATLTMYIALQGLSFLLRDTPGGIMNAHVTSLIQKKVGIIPIAFIILVVAVFAMEFVLRYRPWGLRTRAVGSNEEAARRVGVRVNRTVIFAYMCVGFFVFLGAIILVAQLGIGDPAQGVSYTLTSITAVVLGGTSLLGGRGTFVGTLLGTGLIVQMLNATTFLGLSQTWQYIFQGGFIVIAAVIYSQIRGFGRAQD